MPNPNYIKGRAAEYAVRNTLIGLGYSVIRAAASQGVFDIVGFHKDGRDVLAIQVKRGLRPSPCEYKSAIDLPAAPSVIKLVIWYPPASAAARVLYSNVDPLPEWCAQVRWLPGPPPRQNKLRGL